MKTFFRSTIAYGLAVLARGVLAKYRPKIVMVTGSVGKTSTKDAVAAALSSKYFLRASEKSYNSEFGVPFTIFGVTNPWTSIPAWLDVVKKAIALIVLPHHYPELLVLEVGADRPGDLNQILRIATPDAVVVTRLPDVPVHVEAYASPQAVREEEFAPAYALPDSAPLIISAEDPHALDLAKSLDVSVTTFGTKEGDVRILDISVGMQEGKASGMEATVSVDGKTYTLCAPSAFGRSQMYAPAAALALARALGLSVNEALKGLESYTPPPGRARLLAGKNGSLLIDDSYNASPAAVEEILSSLSLVSGVSRRIVVLGDMLELGRYSTEEHARLGKLAAETADIVVSIGSRSRAICEAAKAAGKSDEEAMHFATAWDAVDTLKNMVREGDLVLIKGSQAIRLERLTKMLLEDPKDASNLVRQDKAWLKKQ